MGKLIMSNNWKISVSELLDIFREVLLAVIPWLEKAKIKWKEGEAYDDWDNIAEALYKNIVCSSLTGEVAFKYTIAKYNFNYDDYASIDFIEVRSKDNSEKKFAFVSFQSSFSPLDSVKVAELNKTDKVVGYTSLKFDSLGFFFVKNINGKKEFIDNIDVEL
ncbi:hypothetical protein Aasi_1725 [Candidatus Amoebophilus asiaticus 5a2]|uniref:Uncharacterized protein n=1 Tax=Amoebophilus asiaticus (strain 5a2) TaxID=452471 RepID=C3L3W6_AMOA5|nr:hypothetical protein [Candidatus Amoebophilus asiaticus]ACP21007.1 hypothetical protein Aasi_1725 [Candidatus Amoebophilus asiaticus 5a2]